MFQDSGDWNVLVTKTAEQQAPGLVVADDTDRKDIDPEISQVVHCIGAATGDDCTLAMSQNQDRGFAGDARNFAEDKFVSDHVSEYGHGDSRE